MHGVLYPVLDLSLLRTCTRVRDGNQGTVLRSVVELRLTSESLRAVSVRQGESGRSDYKIDWPTPMQTRVGWIKHTRTVRNQCGRAATNCLLLDHHRFEIKFDWNNFCCHPGFDSRETSNFGGRQTAIRRSVFYRTPARRL